MDSESSEEWRLGSKRLSSPRIELGGLSGLQKDVQVQVQGGVAEEGIKVGSRPWDCRRRYVIGHVSEGEPLGGDCVF